MKRLSLWSVGLLLVLGACTVPDVGDLEKEKPRECDAEHRCRDGEQCIEGFCRKDQDPCEGVIPTMAYRDADGDGHAATDAVAESFCGPVPAGYVTVRDDCNDTLADTYPGAPEVCDQRDNNCREGEDEGLVLFDYYLDADGDGVGAGTAVRACAQPAGYVSVSGDCDDGEDEVTPGKQDVCDGKNNDCLGGIDDGFDRQAFYRDVDGDGFGSGQPVLACKAPPSHVSQGGDCDDLDPELAPDKPEVCDGKDNDCRNGVDDGHPMVTAYRDLDGDGVGAGEPSEVCQGRQGFVALGGDCDDGDPARTPGKAEVCDDIDNNCADGTDEGFDKFWYRDVDNDGYGRTETPTVRCTAPEGRYVHVIANQFDCDDDTAEVHPGATERCNNRDDNCANGDDEPFLAGGQGKGTSCVNDICSGVYVCNAAQDGTVCNAPAPTSYHPDQDGDGEGAASSAGTKVCPGGTVPVGAVANKTDCEDFDPRNRAGGTEVCDWRDNDCNGNFDEGTCAGIGSLQELKDPVLTGTRHWRTVSVGSGGTPVWVAGLDGVLARREGTRGAFQGFDDRCGNHDWYASWVRPSDGHIFLAGSAGYLAWFNGSVCSLTRTIGYADPLMGIVGFEEGGVTTLYMVSDVGRLFSWVPGGAPSERYDDPQFYYGIHGLRSDLLFVAGGSGNPDYTPFLHRFTPSSSEPAVLRFNGVSSTYRGAVRALWQGSASLGYAVGDSGLVLRWIAGSLWSNVSPPAGTTPDFTSVVALEPSTIYVVDRGAQGKIRRLTSSGWARTVEDINIVVPLYDVAASKPGDFWAVGDYGRVIHFPEP